MTRVIVLAFALAMSACAAQTQTFGASASGGDPPPLPPGVQVPFYDHYCAALGGGRGGEAEFNRLLDAASASGWEMVAITKFEALELFCFKRPRPTTGAAPGA